MDLAFYACAGEMAFGFATPIYMDEGSIKKGDVPLFSGKGVRPLFLMPPPMM